MANPHPCLLFSDYKGTGASASISWNEGLVYTFDENSDAPASFAEAFLNDPEGTITWYENEIDRVDKTILGSRQEV